MCKSHSRFGLEAAKNLERNEESYSIALGSLADQHLA